MLKQVAYNVFIGPLAVPILFELQHGLLKTGFSARIPPISITVSRFSVLGSEKVGFWGGACVQSL